MITYQKGNLLTTNDEYIVQGVNCRGVMNAGVAKVIRDKWPVVYDKYIEFIIGRFGASLSDFQIVDINNPRNRPSHVVNLFTQNNYGRDGKYVSYDAIDEGLIKLAAELKKRNVESLSMPKIGSGLGGGDWKVIERIIENRLRDFHVTIWEIDQEEYRAELAELPRVGIFSKKLN